MPVRTDGLPIVLQLHRIINLIVSNKYLKNQMYYLVVNYEAIFRHRGLKKFSVHNRMCRNVGVLRLFPGITEMTVNKLFQVFL